MFHPDQEYAKCPRTFGGYYILPLLTFHEIASPGVKSVELYLQSDTIFTFTGDFCT